MTIKMGSFPSFFVYNHMSAFTRTLEDTRPAIQLPTLPTMDNTILVTGGAGFIGSNFILRCLARESDSVVNLDKLTYAGNLRNLATVANDQRYEFVEGDIADHTLMRSLLDRRKPHAIVHFAAESHV